MPLPIDKPLLVRTPRQWQNMMLFFAAALVSPPAADSMAMAGLKVVADAPRQAIAGEDTKAMAEHDIVFCRCPGVPPAAAISKVMAEIKCVAAALVSTPAAVIHAPAAALSKEMV